MGEAEWRATRRAVHKRGSLARVRSFSHTTEFGWVFPRAKSGRRSAIDTLWLGEFNQDIKTLQWEIKKQMAYVSSEERDITREDILRNYGQGEKSARKTLETHSKLDAPQSNARIKLSTSSVPSVQCMSGSDCAVSLAPDRGLVEAERPTQEGQSLGDVKLHGFDAETIPTIVLRCEECCSMSEASRDSGFFTTDDSVEILTEGAADKTLYEELEDVLSDQCLPFEACVTHTPVLATGAIPAHSDHNSCPVWFMKFNDSKSLTGSWRAKDWQPSHSIESFSLESITSRISESCRAQGRSGSREFMEEPEFEAGTPVQELCVGSDRLEGLTLRGRATLKGTSDVAELTRSLEKLSQRLQGLRLDLSSLTEQVTESRHDLASMEARASRLLASTVTSRLHLARVKALQRLEDRLQEEWWAAYDPDTPPVNENYIV